jgi:tetratricopeptide (TPR) repeat protein
VNSFKKALEIDTNHEPSRRSLVGIYEQSGDWDGVVEQRQRLLPLLDGQAKFDMYMAIGEACRDKLQDPYQAIDAFSGAARIDPAVLPVTEALLGLYRETRQGQKAADVLNQILVLPDVSKDLPRTAKLYMSLGEILRDEVKDEESAAAAFEKALDAQPLLVQAFTAVEAMLTQGKKWQALEQAYRRMIQRLPKGQETSQARLALWKTLGELYRRVLRDPEGARTAYAVVVKADPEDAAALEIYAEMAAATPGQEAEAIGAFRQLLKVGSAQPTKAMSTLVGLHVARKEYDQAFSAAQVLMFLVGGASAEEQQVVGKLRRYAREAASRSLNDALWRERLLHDKVRGPLADIMSILATQTSGLFVQSVKDLGLNPKRDEIDIEGSMLFFVNMFKYVSRTIGASGLRLFKDEANAARLQFVLTDPPGLVAGEEMFRERPKKELWFAIGKAMAFHRPELRMARLMPHDQLDMIFQAACSVGTSRFVVTADPHIVEKYRRQLEKTLPEPIRMNALKRLARQYCAIQHPGDVRAYMDGAELTSNRVGALLAGDLDVVRKAVLAEKAQVSKLRDETRLRDLAFFCVSEEYALLREQLGLSVVVAG